MKGSHSLQKLFPGVVLPEGGTVTLNTSLLAGDLNGDNFVNEFDYDWLSTNWYLFGDF